MGTGLQQPGDRGLALNGPVIRLDLHPAYNRDRCPVSVFAPQLHLQYRLLFYARTLPAGSRQIINPVYDTMGRGSDHRLKRWRRVLNEKRRFDLRSLL